MIIQQLIRCMQIMIDESEVQDIVNRQAGVCIVLMALGHDMIERGHQNVEDVDMFLEFDSSLRLMGLYRPEEGDSHEEDECMVCKESYVNDFSARPCGTCFKTVVCLWCVVRLRKCPTCRQAYTNPLQRIVRD